MKPHKLQVKLFVANPDVIEASKLVAVFHRWVKERVVDGELLVDVTDYTHVHDGPGVLLVGHGCDYGLDFSGGRAGLLFSRKRGGLGEAERTIDVLRRALDGAHRLEQEPSLGLSFRTDEALFRIADRLQAPNSDDTLTVVRPELEAALARVYGETAFTLARVGSERELFAVRVDAPGAPPAATLLGRL